MNNSTTSTHTSHPPSDQQITSPKLFKLTTWSNRQGKNFIPLGKRFGLEKDRLVNEGLGVHANHADVVEIKSLDDLVLIMELDLIHGRAFITSGTPIDESIRSADVMTKDRKRSGHISRSKEDIAWRDGVGTYFPIDHDANWDSEGPKSLDSIRQAFLDALAYAGVEASDLQMIGYESSSSGFVRKSDDARLDKGGRHLLFLVDEAGDLKRFRRAMDVYLTVTGWSYGAVSNAGTLLRRSILDFAAVSPTQPTFAGVPAYDQEVLTNVREKQMVQHLGGEAVSLDTTRIRDPDEDDLAAFEQFWRNESRRLKDELVSKRRDWFRSMGKELSEKLPGASPERIRRLLEHRQSGDLVGSDVIRLNGTDISVSEILINPEQFEGQMGPDPIEPSYRKGAQVSKVFLNRDNGRPMIHSKAHGGLNYRLWHDPATAIKRLQELSFDDANAAAPDIISNTRFSNNGEIESYLKDVARILRTTKKALTKDYAKSLYQSVFKPLTEDAEDRFVIGDGSPAVNDVAHEAARRYVERETRVVADDDQVWRFCGTHFEPISDRYLGSKLRKDLTRFGWPGDANLTKTTQDAITSVKHICYEPVPIIAREPKKILNFSNGELHFLGNGDVEFRDHDPRSGLTSVLPISYDPSAEAPVFKRTLEQIFWPPAQERLKARSKKERQQYERQYLREARALRRHLEEVIAYLIIPSRWIPAWFVWIGDGHNGKTFLARILNLLLSPDVVESDRLKAYTSDNFGMERLIGKTLLIDDDLDTGTTIPDGFVKKISESKRLSANRKHKTSFTFENRCALLLLTNNYPGFVDVSPGMLRRIHSIVFPRRFYSTHEIDALPDAKSRELAMHDLADPGLIDAIEEELPGVVNVLARAYQRLILRGGFAFPESVLKSNERILNEGNPLPMFIDICCEKGMDCREKTSEFFRLLMRWAIREHINWNPSARQVRKMMHHLGWHVVTVNGIEHYVGIRVITNATHEDKSDWDEDIDVDDWDDLD
jgi:putative DNA primase/helicase